MSKRDEMLDCWARSYSTEDMTWSRLNSVEKMMAEECIDGVFAILQAPDDEMVWAGVNTLTADCSGMPPANAVSLMWQAALAAAKGEDTP